MINIKTGDVVNQIKSYVNNTLSVNPSKLIQRTLTELSFLGSLDFKVTQVGGVSNIFFVRGIPQNDDGTDAADNLLYHSGSGSSIYFETEDQLNNTFGPGIIIDNATTVAGSLI